MSSTTYPGKVICKLRKLEKDGTEHFHIIASLSNGTCEIRDEWWSEGKLIKFTCTRDFENKTEEASAPPLYKCQLPSLNLPMNNDRHYIRSDNDNGIRCVNM